ncbi:tripartite tricarboxylate transporter TctB family protein [Clostridium sp. AN503]|uniref:tripartite tricarboxylate transporter TctB family protein n=1 Tax=Clostridium sp. AN503 TaxID=3160598 RepID=UPI00345ADB2A
MKKLNRTYIMGAVFLVFSVWVLWQTTMIPERLVSNEPGPKLFPYISAFGMILMAVLSMVFDGRKEAEEAKKGPAPYLDQAGWKRMFLIMAECIMFCAAMNWIGFWITSMAGMMIFILTLRAEKKINLIFAVVLSVLLGSICYFGFTRGFHIPLPKGVVWESLGIRMP